MFNEPAADKHAALTVAQVAKAAEFAAICAQSDEPASGDAALSAYTWARDGAHGAEAAEMLEQLQTDFAALYRVAKLGRWSNRTPVPAEVFELMVEDVPTKPWWKVW
jgi:hypothetical protein